MHRPSVAIIGAGFSGLGMAVQMKKAGYQDITIFDKAPKVGGTWYWNTYPGCSCDVKVHLYSYSFAPYPDWPRAYPSSADIQKYLEHVADTFGLRAHLRLSTEVTSAHWDEGAAVWRLTLADGSAQTAQILVSGLGQLDIPAWPQIEGSERFAGSSFHAARWDHDVALAGKRVGVIGAAASAVQLIPEVAKAAAHLTVFQRSANYILPRADRIYEDKDRAAFRDQAWMMQLIRQNIYWPSELLFWGAFKGGDWRVKYFENECRKHLETQVSDPVLRRKLTPDYPIGCKRILFADDYYPALQRENVALVTERIAAIRAEGVETADGALYPLDVLVYATGFDASHFRWSVEIFGEAGLRLKDAWAEGPEAYLGVITAGFPNFFLLYGPNTNLGHTSILFMVERQIAYILALLEEAQARGARAVSVRKAAQDRYNRVIQAELKQLPWASGCASWYKTETGKITNNWPRSTQDYARAMRRPDFSHFTFASPAPARLPAPAPTA